MASFKVPCPSCEAPVLIKNPNLIGTKVECPKCKYRFKVEEPTAPGADPKDKKTADAKGKSGKNKKLVKILAGVGAVVVLAVVAVVGFGGGDGKPKYTGPTGPGAKSNTGGTTEDPKGDNTQPKVDNTQPSIPASTKNTTNLLPPEAVAVYRFNLDQSRHSPAYEQLVDHRISLMFRDSMGFGLDDVETYIHSFAGDDRAPFGIIRLKIPAKPNEVAAGVKAIQGKPKAVKSYTLYKVHPNPFINAVSNALSMASLFGEYFETLPMTGADKKDKPTGLCVYDTQHILVGDYALLEQFLNELDASGYPPFKTTMIAAPAPGTTPTPGATPGTPPTPGMQPMTPMGAPNPMTPAPPTPPPSTPTTGDKAYTSVDAYRTIEYPLKKALDDMEADRAQTPLFVYAEKFDVRHYDPRMLKKDYQAIATFLDPIASRTRYLSANVLHFTSRRVIGNLRLTLGSSEDASTLAKEQFAPTLEILAELLKQYLLTPVEFRDYSAGGSATTPGNGFPQFPMGPMGTFPGPTGTFPGPMGMGTFPGPMGSSMGPGPMGSGMGPGGLRPPMPMGPGGPGSFFPPGGPGPGGFPNMPMGPGDPNGGQPEPKEGPPTASHIDLGMVDKQLLIAFDISMTDSIYRRTVAPRLASIANQIKGKMAVFSADFSWHAIAAAGPQAEKTLKSFPRGTADRRSDQTRYGLPYPPDTRVSLFRELLPFLGRESLAKQIDPHRAWFDVVYEKVDERFPDRKPRVIMDNLTPAGEWVPELLVPYYPQSAWRATSPYAPDHVLGATNYVAIAGVGLDIARENPNSPEFKKKVGITGYSWGSKAEEITDGLSNTIYMMQTPPGLQQPWIAGGGATVRGFDENDPMAAFRYTHPGREKQGTYALMADGSVRWIPADIDPKVLKALATRAGGEAIADVDTEAPKVEPPKKTTELKADPKLLIEPKKPEDKKPDDKKPDDKKPADPKATDPKKPAEKKEPGAKTDPAPAPKEKK